MTMQLFWGFAVCKIFLEWGLLRFHEQVLHDLRKWLHHAVWERKKNPQNYEKYCKILNALPTKL